LEIFSLKYFAPKTKYYTLDYEHYREQIIMLIIYIYVPQLEGVWGKEGKVPQSKTKVQRRWKQQWLKKDGFIYLLGIQIP